MAHGMSTPLSNRPVRMMHVNSCCRTGLMAVVNMRHLRFVYALFAIILTGSGANGDECQLNCTVPRDPEGNIKFESLTRGCHPFPFGEDPEVHQWQVAAPRELQVEERIYPCGNGHLLGMVIKWRPPEYSIDKLRGFQVRVTPLSASEVGDQPLMCQDILLSNNTVLRQKDEGYIFSVDCLQRIHPGHRYYIEVQSLPVQRPGSTDNTVNLEHTAKDCSAYPSVDDCPQPGEKKSLENYIMPGKPMGEILQVSNIRITFEKYPDFYNVISYTVKLCKITIPIGCILQNEEVKTFHTTFEDVEPGLYEGKVAPSGCLDCIWRTTQPINVTEWKPSFVNVVVTAEDTVSVYFDMADGGSAGMEIQKYTIELINQGTNETRSIDVTENPAYFQNVARGTYRAKAKAARCTIGCPWAVSKSVQVPVKVEIPHPHTTDSSSSVSSTTVIGTQRHDPSTLQKVTTQPKDVTRLALGVAGGVIGGLLLVLVLYCVRRKKKSKSANYLSNSPSTSTFGIIEDTRGSLDDPTCNEDDTEALISLSTPQPQPPPPPEGGEEIPPYRYYKPPAHDQMSGTDGMSSIIQKLNMSPDNQEVIFDQYRRKEAEGEEVRPVLSADEELTQNWYGGPEYHPEMYNGSTIPGSFRPPYVYVREISLERKSDEAGGDRFDSGFQEMEQLERMRDFDQLEHMRTLVVEGMKAHTSTVSADIHNDSRSINI